MQFINNRLISGSFQASKESQQRLFWSLQTCLSASKRMRCIELILKKSATLAQARVQASHAPDVRDQELEYLWSDDFNDQELIELIDEAEKNESCFNRKRARDPCTLLSLPELVSHYHKQLTAGCPLALQVRGPVENIGRRSVAIIGARHPTLKGRQTAFRFAQSLSKLGYFIWSGGAIGIDTCAIKGCLQIDPSWKHGSNHVSKFFGVGAVLGSGIDCPYPTSNISLFSNSKLTLVSEFDPNRKAYPYQFPMRNFTIAWLADYVLVVEAKQNSGSIITAQCAASLGKSVGAIKWPAGHQLSSGNQALHDSGAEVIETPEQLHQQFSSFLY